MKALNSKAPATSRGLVRGMLVAIALFLGGLLAAPVPASAATYLGGVNVASYCARNVASGNPYVASRAVNINNRWDGWRCATTYGALVTVNMNLACAQQYPKSWWWQPTAYADHGTSISAYSWGCYR
jgi:hypothetical protein